MGCLKPGVHITGVFGIPLCTVAVALGVPATQSAYLRPPESVLFCTHSSHHKHTARHPTRERARSIPILDLLRLLAHQPLRGPWILFLLILVFFSAFSFSVIYHNYWVIPHRHIACSATPGVLKQKEILELRNNIRQSFIQALGVLGGVIGGAVLLGGLYFTARTLRISLRETLRVNQKTLETTQQRQITERFTEAIEQLGSENRAIRLGGNLCFRTDYFQVCRG